MRFILVNAKAESLLLFDQQAYGVIRSDPLDRAGTVRSTVVQVVTYTPYLLINTGLAL